MWLLLLWLNSEYNILKRYCFPIIWLSSSGKYWSVSIPCSSMISHAVKSVILWTLLSKMITCAVPLSSTIRTIILNLNMNLKILKRLKPFIYFNLSTYKLKIFIFIPRSNDVCFFMFFTVPQLFLVPWTCSCVGWNRCDSRIACLASCISPPTFILYAMYSSINNTICFLQYLIKHLLKIK